MKNIRLAKMHGVTRIGFYSFHRNKSLFETYMVQNKKKFVNICNSILTWFLASQWFVQEIYLNADNVIHCSYFSNACYEKINRHFRSVYDLMLVLNWLTQQQKSRTWLFSYFHIHFIFFSILVSLIFSAIIHCSHSCNTCW